MRIQLLTLCMSCSLLCSAQTADQKQLNYVYSQKSVPMGIDNYLFSTYYYSGKKTFNLRGATMSSTKPVASLRINPSGSSFAVLEENGGKGSVKILDLWKSDKVLYDLEDKDVAPSAICYSPDSRTFAIARTDKKVYLYDTRDYKALQKLDIQSAAKQMTISGNNYFLAVAEGESIEVWNLQNNSLRTSISASAAINDLEFSIDNSKLAVLTADGKLQTYDTKTFKPIQTYDAMGEARHCYFHQDGKYIAVVTGDKRISIVNLLNVRDRDFVDNQAGGITDIRFIKDSKKQTFLAYNTLNSITYSFMNKLSPFYTKLLADELNDKMKTWMKQMPGETLDDYNKRVNDKTRAEQLVLFEREIATRMAGNLTEHSEITLGSYNPTSHLLAVQFSTMPNIYLDVPGNEVNDFADPGKLEFKNAVYGLNKQDQFELIYADVYNKSNGKTYVFNNLERKSLDYLQSDDNFVPLAIVQKSNMEEMKLQSIKNDMIKLAKQHNTISDNTHITVDANAVSDVDASGKKITNYKINFSYTVEKQYSAKEDFPAGKYKTEQSGAALAMLSIMKKAFETDFAPYIIAGKRLLVKITGTADASPISGSIAYDGCYGDFNNEPVYKDNDLSTVTVTKANGITDNEQLAFLRAVGVKDYIVHNVPSFANMNAEYNYNIEIAKNTGSEFRRITLEYTFVDAF